MITAIAAIAGLLGVWLYLCDKQNEFAPALLVVGLVGLGVGGALGM